MRAKIYRDIETNESVTEIRVAEVDLQCLRLTPLDRLLIKECDESNSLADHLLALETIVRKHEKRQTP